MLKTRLGRYETSRWKNVRVLLWLRHNRERREVSRTRDRLVVVINFIINIIIIIVFNRPTERYSLRPVIYRGRSNKMKNRPMLTVSVSTPNIEIFKYFGIRRYDDERLILNTYRTSSNRHLRSLAKNRVNFYWAFESNVQCCIWKNDSKRNLFVHLKVWKFRVKILRKKNLTVQKLGELGKIIINPAEFHNKSSFISIWDYFSTPNIVFKRTANIKLLLYLSISSQFKLT